MRGLLRLAQQGFSKKLGIAETAKVIQEKIINITQVVLLSLSRTTLKSSVPSSALETVLPELSVSTEYRQERWWSSALVLEVWPLTSKLTMSELSSSETIGIFESTQINSGRRHCDQNWCYRRCSYRRGNVG